MDEKNIKSLINRHFSEILGYVASLDGLRALSIIMVSLIHTFS
jgi:hypothetical protein